MSMPQAKIAIQPKKLGPWVSIDSPLQSDLIYPSVILPI
jgi:hypothetical protein